MPNTSSYTWAQINTDIIEAMQEDANFSDKFVAEIPRLVKAAESKVYADLNLEIFDRVRTGSLTASQFLQAIKTSTWQGTKSFFIRDAGGTGLRRFLRKRSYEYCQSYQPDETVTGEPLFYAEYSDSQFFVVPAPNAAYAFELREISQDTTLGLSATQTTTWLSTHAGDLLFYSLCIEAERWLQGDQADVSKWEAEYNTRLNPIRVTLRDLVRTDYDPMQNQPRPVQDKP